MTAKVLYVDFQNRELVGAYSDDNRKAIVKKVYNQAFANLIGMSVTIINDNYTFYDHQGGINYAYLTVDENGNNRLFQKDQLELL